MPYTYRTAAVAAEVVTLPDVADPAFLPTALAATQPETACRAIRILLASGDLASAQAVGTHLIRLVTPRLRLIARHYFRGLPDLQAELAQDLACVVWQTVSDLRPTHDFLCANFWVAINRDAGTLAERQYRRGRAERPFPVDLETGASAAETWPTPALDPADAVLVADLLAALPPRERAVALLLAQEVPPQEIAARLGCTDRTIRNVRRRAAAHLTAAGLAPAAPSGGHSLVNWLEQLWRRTWAGPVVGWAT